MKCPEGGIFFNKDNLRITCEEHCDYKNVADPEEEERIVREENEWAAMETLGRVVVYKWPEVPPMWTDTPATESWQSYLMYLLKPICRHYQVNDDNVLAKFMRHYLMTIMLSPRHKKPKP